MEQTFETFDRVLSFAGIRIFSKNKFNSKLWYCFQIFSALIASMALVFTTGFVVTNATDLQVLLKGAAVWSTCIILSITLIICLIFRNKFRSYLIEMLFVDFMLEMPLIKYALKDVVDDGKMKELKNLVIDSQNKLLKVSIMLLKLYIFAVFLTATMYLCDPIVRMIVRENKDERIFGMYNISVFFKIEYPLFMDYISYLDAKLP